MNNIISARTQSLIDLLPKNHLLTPKMRTAIIDVGLAVERAKPAALSDRGKTDRADAN
jgi:hypothetical protein